VDVTLACCDGKYLKSHKLILSACSPYFHKLLQDNPCHHPIIILKDVRGEEMENILSFMYNGEVQIGQEDLNDFLKTAQTLQIKGLTEVNQQYSQQKSGDTSNSSSRRNSSTGAINCTIEENSPKSVVKIDLVEDDQESHKNFIPEVRIHDEMEEIADKGNNSEKENNEALIVDETKEVNETCALVTVAPAQKSPTAASNNSILIHALKQGGNNKKSNGNNAKKPVETISPGKV